MNNQQHHNLVKQIQKLRRSYPMGEDMKVFRSLVGPTTMRWTTAILETEVDHGFSGSIGASVFSQMVKLMDSVYLQKDGQVMYADVHAFNRSKDDMINNLLYRIRREMPDYLYPVWDSYLLQLQEHSPSFKWLSERYPNFWDETFYRGRLSYEDKNQGG